MIKLKQKLIKADYIRLLKHWLVLALCVVLLGGGLSAVMLQPQISETFTALQTMKYTDKDWEDGNKDAVQRDLDRHNDREKHSFPEKLDITEPSQGAKITVGITGLLGCLVGAAFWLLIAAWLYQMAVLSEMNSLFWGLLGLIGNVIALIVFLLVRSFFRRKCPACGRWQKDGSFCRSCGTRMKQMCPVCGAECETEDVFCANCGSNMRNDNP